MLRDRWVKIDKKTNGCTQKNACLTKPYVAMEAEGAFTMQVFGNRAQTICSDWRAFLDLPMTSTHTDDDRLLHQLFTKALWSQMTAHPSAIIII